MSALTALARICAGTLVLACAASGCRRPQTAHEEARVVDETRDAPAARPAIADVLKRHTPSLLAIPGVVGTGEGRAGDRPVIVVFVARRTSELRQRIPSALEGYPVEIRESGEVTAPPR